jgi:predicted phosphodiesterase
MRIAIVSDIHGNRTAFDAVLADLRQTAPDLILHGGDLAHGGASPAEIVDRIRELAWPGVLGNTDEMLFRPESLQEFASQSLKLQPAFAKMFAMIEEMAVWDRETLGEARLVWLHTLPLRHVQHQMALVHASPESCWRAPAPEAGDAELKSVYSPLNQPIVIYGHVHRSYIRKIDIRKISGMNTPGMIVANTGSVSLSHDGDRRASYLLLDDSKPEIRRVEYDVEKELKALTSSSLPHAAWIARTLESASPQMP